ncbi:helix-turn-helix domain-containing protein [Puniceicoccus vermicola]|uniref:Helix-turn-helix domain-containing protein n=1 Tax=Puniceicoccus vermicola TaxID=388746 RepID=A0A7X1B1K0_9BACT|nr:helix-turn-helix domain-containing protein [Puniceicoccus vermicola]MBC2603940.1 helix-turn-helix domain-containing protein [Puniceicoccus vermicola]
MAQSQSVQSLHRALDILESIATSPAGMTLQELSERTRLKNTTLFNLARTLADRGYLEKTHTRPIRYGLGASVEALNRGTAFGSGAAIDESLLKLAEEHPQWRFITAEAEGVDVLCDRLIEPSRKNVVIRGSRTWLPPYTSASSLCHLAFWPSHPRKQCETLYPFAMYGAGYWGSAQKLESAIAKVREVGFVDIHDRDPHRVAVPLFNRNNALKGSLGASFPGDSSPSSSERQSVIDALLAESKRLLPFLDRQRPQSQSIPHETSLSPVS